MKKDMITMSINELKRLHLVKKLKKNSSHKKKLLKWSIYQNVNSAEFFLTFELAVNRESFINYAEKPRIANLTPFFQTI